MIRRLPALCEYPRGEDYPPVPERETNDDTEPQIFQGDLLDVRPVDDAAFCVNKLGENLLRAHRWRISQSVQRAWQQRLSR